MADTNVLIVGAGPVGLTTALGLARSGVGVTVLEASDASVPGHHDMIYRAGTLAGLQRLGVLDDLLRAGLTSHRWRLQVRPTGEHIDFDLASLADEIEHPYHLHLRSDRLATAVLPHLSRHGHATVEWGTRVTGVEPDDHGVTVTAHGPDGPRTYRAAWVVGTDGAHSIVRRSVGLGFAGMTWPDRFVAVDSRFDWTEVGFVETNYQLDPEYPALAAKIDATGLWRYIYAENRTLPEATIAERMPSVFKAVLPDGADPAICGWSAYRVHERAADRFRVGRVVLAGDAAHVTNPTSSLGLAGGLFDSFVLTGALAAVVHGEADEAVLDRYAETRRRVFLDVTSPLASRSMHLVFNSGDPAVLEAELEHYRRAATDPALLRELHAETARLETPPLY